MNQVVLFVGFRQCNAVFSKDSNKSLSVSSSGPKSASVCQGKLGSTSGGQWVRKSESYSGYYNDAHSQCSLSMCGSYNMRASLSGYGKR
jgi:hypothetical protein